MFRLLAISALLSAAIAVPATAQASSAAEIERCQMMAATLAPKKAEMESLLQKRAALTAQVEELGDVWEADEATRMFNARAGMTADQSKSEYEKVKTELLTLERGLQANGRQFNRDVADYNRSCATN